MAYQRSMDMQVRVKTDTLTEILYLHFVFVSVVVGFVTFRLMIELVRFSEKSSFEMVIFVDVEVG